MLTGLLAFALATMCGTQTGLDYQPTDRPEKQSYRLEKTVDLAKEQLSRKDMELTETVFTSRYGGAYGIKFSGDYYQDTFFIAIDPKTMSYVRLWKNNLICK